MRKHTPLGPHPMDMTYRDRFVYWYGDVHDDESFVIVHAPIEDITACGATFPNMVAFGRLTIGLSCKFSPQSGFALQRAGIRYEITRKAEAYAVVEQEEAAHGNI